MSDCKVVVLKYHGEKVKNSIVVLTGALEAVFVVRSLPVRVAEPASLGGAPSFLLVLEKMKKS